MDSSMTSDNFLYQCKNCDWTGQKSELVFDTVETCLGNDSIEMCPFCGSYEVVLQKDQWSSKQSG